MQECKSVNILDALEGWGKKTCAEILDSYRCPKNLEIERFAREQTIDFAHRMVAITYLVMSTGDEKPCLLGYFTLANKFAQI